MRVRVLVWALVVLTLAAVATTTVAAQEVDRSIEFEENVTAGEETTITFVSVVEEAPAEVTADIDLTLFVDDQEVDSTTITRDISDGTEIRVNFTHTFESAGERKVRVETLTQALGTEIEGSAEATVTVAEAGGETDDGTDEGAEDGGGMDGNQTDDGGMEDGSDDGMDGDGGMEDGNGTDGSEGDDGGDEDPGQGLPGFTAVAALVATVAVAAYARR